MTHSNKIARNTAFTLVNKLLTIFVAFFSRKLFLVFLTEELLGLNSLFTDLLGLLNLADMGLGIAVQFELYKPIADKNYEKIGSILNATKRIYNVVGIGIIAAGAVLSLFIQHLIMDNPYPLSFLRLVFFINVVSNASTYFFVHKRLYLQASEDLHVVNTVDSLVNVGGSILRIIAIALFRNYYAFVILSALQAVVSNFLVGYYCDKRHSQIKGIRGYQKQEMKTLLGNLKELLPNKISAYVFSNTDNTILSTFLGLTSVTLFTNYNSIVLQLFSFAAMLSGVLRASFGNVFQENHDKRSQLFLVSSYQLLQFFFSSFCAVSLVCLLDDFVGLLYGEKFIVPFAFVVILTVDFFLHSMYLPLSAILEVLGEFKALKRQEIFSMIANIAVSVGLVVPFGIIGPIFGTLVVDICTTAFRLFTVVYKNYRFLFRQYFTRYLTYIVVFFAEYAGIYLLLKALPFERSIPVFLLKGVICFIVTTVVNVALFRKTEEFAYLFSKIKSMVKRK